MTNKSQSNLAEQISSCLISYDYSIKREKSNIRERRFGCPTFDNTTVDLLHSIFTNIDTSEVFVTSDIGDKEPTLCLCLRYPLDYHSTIYFEDKHKSQFLDDLMVYKIIQILQPYLARSTQIKLANLFPNPVHIDEQNAINRRQKIQGFIDKIKSFFTIKDNENNWL